MINNQIIQSLNTLESKLSGYLANKAKPHLSLMADKLIQRQCLTLLEELNSVTSLPDSLVQTLKQKISSFPAMNQRSNEETRERLHELDRRIDGLRLSFLAATQPPEQIDVLFKQPTHLENEDLKDLFLEIEKSQKPIESYPNALTWFSKNNELIEFKIRNDDFSFLNYLSLNQIDDLFGAELKLHNFELYLLHTHIFKTIADVNNISVFTKAINWFNKMEGSDEFPLPVHVEIKKKIEELFGRATALQQLLGNGICYGMSTSLNGEFGDLTNEQHMSRSRYLQAMYDMEVFHKYKTEHLFNTLLKMDESERAKNSPSPEVYTLRLSDKSKSPGETVLSVTFNPLTIDGIKVTKQNTIQTSFKHFRLKPERLDTAISLESNLPKSAIARLGLEIDPSSTPIKQPVMKLEEVVRDAASKTQESDRYTLSLFGPQSGHSIFLSFDPLQIRDQNLYDPLLPYETHVHDFDNLDEMIECLEGLMSGSYKDFNKFYLDKYKYVGNPKQLEANLVHKEVLALKEEQRMLRTNIEFIDDRKSRETPKKF